MTWDTLGVVIGVIVGVIGLASLLSLGSFDRIEWVGDRGPEAILRGESFNGDNERFLSRN